MGSQVIDSYVNDDAGPVPGSADPGDLRAFHARLPGYAPTPLVSAPALARELGVADVWIKDESSRLDLPAFKILGASWATFRALEDRAGQPLLGWVDVDELAVLVREKTPVRRLAAATDGNHGRAVARTARWLGMSASIFVPAGTVRARIEAIQAEGATVEVVDGTYGDAVKRSAREAGDDCLVISDTSWDGYVDIPAWVIDGYRTIFEEVDEQLGGARPDVVVVQIGVGALAAAVASRYRRPGAPPVRLLGVEPDSAACLLVSMRAGAITSVPGPHRSIMAGLNTDTPSIVAWPAVSTGFDAFVSVDDDAARAAMRALAAAGVESGETGAAGLAGFSAVCAGEAPAVREALGLSASTSVLMFSTEGATDPAAYRAVVGAERTMT